MRRAVAECVPPGHPLPPPVQDDLVDEGWGDLVAPVRRWLAARAFASWLALQGEEPQQHPGRHRCEDGEQGAARRVGQGGQGEQRAAQDGVDE